MRDVSKRLIILLFLCLLLAVSNSIAAVKEAARQIECTRTVTEGQSIQEAINAANSNMCEKICVESGLYREHININKRVQLYNAPGSVEKPVIEPGGTSSSVRRVEVNVAGTHVCPVVIDGFEIRKGYDGVKLYEDWAIVRNNIIHDNVYQNILVVSSNHILIEGNEIYNAGTNCTDLTWGGLSQKHCHGIYFSNFNCEANFDQVVRENYIHDNPGAGTNMNNKNGCGGRDSERDVTIDGNRYESNCVGIFPFYRVSNLRIINNEFTMPHACPPSNFAKVDRVYINYGFQQGLKNVTETGNTFDGRYRKYRGKNIYSHIFDSFVNKVNKGLGSPFIERENN